MGSLYKFDEYPCGGYADEGTRNSGEESSLGGRGKSVIRKGGATYRNGGEWECEMGLRSGCEINLRINKDAVFRESSPARECGEGDCDSR